ncbi:MAG TPA: hypothetical protein VGW40_01650 [Allosphingosinicella sp.]|nr:hypothetical protein [Allosphingosinicella sp.]
MTLIRKFWSLLFTVLLAGSVSTAAQAQSCSRPAPRPFRIFDATAYVGRPDWSRYGIEPIHIVDRGLWPEGAGRSGPPDPALVRRYVESLPRDNAPIVLDIEHYDLTGSDEAARVALTDLRRLAATFRAIAPDRQIGFYGIIPIPAFAPAVAGPGSPPHRAWQRQNDRLRSLQGSVTMLFPSAYTDHPDPASWAAAAAGQICEARRLSSKPVYVFIWPEFHEASPLRGQYLDAEFWRLQLETAYRLADGVVIFGGYDLQAGRPRNWNPRAPWYAPTLAFIRERLRRP